MSNVIELSRRDRVEITQVRFIDEQRPDEQGPLQYMVTLIEEGPDGGELGLWYGDEHADALHAARAIPASLGLNYPIIDRTTQETLQ